MKKTMKFILIASLAAIGSANAQVPAVISSDKTGLFISAFNHSLKNTQNLPVRSLHLSYSEKIKTAPCCNMEQYCSVE
jgi:hypothetical protein